MNNWNKRIDVIIINKFKEFEQINNDKENNYKIFKCGDKNKDNKWYQLKYIYYDDKLIDN